MSERVNGKSVAMESKGVWWNNSHKLNASEKVNGKSEARMSIGVSGSTDTSSACKKESRVFL